VSFTPRPLYFQGKILHYPPCRRLFRPHTYLLSLSSLKHK